MPVPLYEKAHASGVELRGLRLPGWAAARQRCGAGGSALAMGFPCVTLGSDARFLTMDDAPTSGDRRPACTEPRPCPSLYPGPPAPAGRGEGDACHEPKVGQPPTTPWVST